MSLNDLHKPRAPQSRHMPLANILILSRLLATAFEGRNGPLKVLKILPETATWSGNQKRQQPVGEQSNLPPLQVGLHKEK